MMILKKVFKRLLIRTTGLNTKRCIICQRPLSSLSNNFIFANINLCRKCYNRLPFVYYHFKIEKTDALAIYKYTEELSQLILQLKADGDIEIAKIFLGPIKEFLKCQFAGYTIIPVPSYEGQNKKRGFNHIIEIARPLGLPIVPAFYKAKKWKQSNQKKHSRSQISKVIKLMPEKLDPKKKYLLIDDIITTGSSIKACLHLLDSFHITKVRVLVITYNCRR